MSCWPTLFIQWSYIFPVAVISFSFHPHYFKIQDTLNTSVALPSISEFRSDKLCCEHSHVIYLPESIRWPEVKKKQISMLKSAAVTIKVHSATLLPMRSGKKKAQRKVIILSNMNYVVFHWKIHKMEGLSKCFVPQTTFWYITGNSTLQIWKKREHFCGYIGSQKRKWEREELSGVEVRERQDTLHSYTSLLQVFYHPSLVSMQGIKPQTHSS